jgi:hypothetical protein
MSSLVPLFLRITFIYFSYLPISYKVRVVHMIHMFLSSSFVPHLEARVRHEHYLLIHLTSDLLTPFMFVHKRLVFFTSMTL